MSVMQRPRYDLPSTDRLVTAEELAEHPEWGPCELIRGKVVPVSPPKPQHGLIVLEIAASIRDFARPRKLGRVFTESGVFIDRAPDTVRGPDVGFISAARFAVADLSKYLDTPPELLVEVVSPTDRWSDITEKVDMYLGMGVMLVWVVDPQVRKAHVYRNDRAALIVPATGELDGEDVLPGYKLPLKDVFSVLDD